MDDTHVMGHVPDRQNTKVQAETSDATAPFWRVSGNRFDLTRGRTEDAFTVRPTGSEREVVLSGSKSALVIVDMQNFFLHHDRRPNSLGRAIIPGLIEAIHSCRQKGMRIIWLNWGISPAELSTIPSGVWHAFAENGDPLTSFGHDMGNGFGEKLMRGEYNALTYGALFEEQEKGIKAGTDVLIHKNRISGLWKPDTALGQYLQDEGLISLFFAGVNTDQCVYGTLADAFHQGYDTFLVRDACATGAPEFCTDMVLRSSTVYGWVVTTADIVKAASENQ